MWQTLQALDWAPFWLSLKVAGVATALAWCFGVGLGWVFARTRLPGRGLLEAICMLPLVLPPTVIGYAILLAAGRRSAPLLSRSFASRRRAILSSSDSQILSRNTPSRRSISGRVCREK